MRPSGQAWNRVEAANTAPIVSANTHQPSRWCQARASSASPASLARMRALGVGWLVQNALHFRGEELLQQHGEGVRNWPRIGQARRLGMAVGMGTDAHRVMSYNPFVALRWLVDGRTVAGTPIRAPDAALSRLEALRLYTEGSAWFAHDDMRRGALEAGRLADLAVLNADYLAVPAERIGDRNRAIIHVSPNVTQGRCNRVGRGTGRSPLYRLRTHAFNRIPSILVKFKID